MLLIKLCLLIVIYFVGVHTDAAFSNVPSGMANLLPQSPNILPEPAKCSLNSTTEQKSSGLQFRLPFMDMEVKNEHNLHIIQEPHKQFIFILHGNELFQMFVGRQEKRLSLIGKLMGGIQDIQPLGVKVTFWRNYFIFTIALEEYIEIYQIFETRILERAEQTKKITNNSNDEILFFEPIQQLTLLGKFNKLLLIEPQAEKIMLVVAMNFTKLYGKFRTYEWSNTYFDLIEELTVPPIHVLHVVGTNPKFLISGKVIRHQSKTILTIYEFKLPTMRLRSQQTLTVNSRTVHAMTFHGKNYIIACAANQKKCNTFRMSDGQFNLYKRRASNELTFDKIEPASNYVVAAVRPNEIKVFKNARLDCYVSFTSNETDINSILTHRNGAGESFVLLNYKRTFKSLIRIVEIESESGALLTTNTTEAEELLATPAQEHQHIFETTIASLRSTLLRRKSAVDVFRKIATVFRPKLNNAKIRNAVSIESGNIGIVTVEGTLQSPVEIMKRVEDLRVKYRKTRFARASEQAEKINLNMTKELKVKHLKVENLIYEGNLIKGFDLDTKTRNLPTLSIRPALTTKVLNTHELLTPKTNTTTRKITSSSNDTLPALKTKNLHVKFINNIAWDEFYDMLFLKNRDSKMQSRLVLQAAVNIDNLYTPLLNNLAVDQLFNLKQPQVITSDILISKISITDLRAEQVNGLSFAEDIIFAGRDTFIETPIKMSNISIAGDILYGENTTLPRLTGDDDSSTQFQQYYTGKVIINGSLTINNLLSDQAAKILVNDTLISVNDITETYLLKNEPQNFTTPVIFDNAKVTMSSLQTNYLNDHPTEDHLLKSGNTTLQNPLYVVFMLAEVDGDLVATNYKSTIRELHENAVRHGEIANITGEKIFEAPLEVDSLMTLSLNDMPVNELVLKSQLSKEFKFNGTKYFKNIAVKGEAHVENSLKAEYLNNLPLNELLNYDYHFDHLYLPYKLQARNIVFHKLNGVPFDDVFLKFHIHDGDLVLHKNLIIDGNVQFKADLIVQYINDISWTEYEQSLVRLDEPAVISGPKRFLSELTITKTLQTPVINNVNMDEIFLNILSKSKPQLITGSYTFGNLNLAHLIVNSINNVPTSSFIDMRTEEIIIESDIIVPKMIIYGNLKGNFVNDFKFETITERLIELPRRQWLNVVVRGNAHWNVSDANGKTCEDQLKYLYKNAVRRLGNQVITGNVHLRRPLITKMVTKTAFPKDIDFDFIAKDCLLKNTTLSQTVSGMKTFRQPLQMQKVVANTILHADLLNHIDILRLNASLYRLTSGEPVRGPLHFKTPPVIGHLVTEGSVNGIKTANIYPAAQLAVPTLKVHTLSIDNSLQIQDINDMNLNYLLENRITKTGDALEVFGHLTFENLILQKQILLQTINGIPIDSLVLKKSNYLQAITAPKFIAGTLELAGPAHVLYLNGQNLIDTYQQSIFKERNYYIDNLFVEKATFEQGLTFENDDDDDDDDDKLKLSKAQTNDSANLTRVNARTLRSELQVIDNLIDVNVGNKSKQFLYLDYDLNTEILWQAPGNETIQYVQQFEIKRISSCERQMLQLQLPHAERRLFLSNFTTNIVSASDANNNVTVENYCKSKYRKVRSKITIVGKELLKIFGMKKSIETVALYTTGETNTFVLLHAIDLTTQRNEVRILRIDNLTHNISDWQALTNGVGSSTMHLFTYENHTLLICSGLMHQHPAVTLYKFDTKLQQFKMLQIIDGDFDIMQLVAFSTDKYHLILSCRHCQRISIYEFSLTNNETSSSYQIFQLLKLSMLIDNMLTFTLADGSFYLLVLSERDFYHLYKYSYIAGWLHYTYGYFHNIQIALPLDSENLRVGSHKPLLLLCNASANCNLVHAVIKH